MKGLQGQIDEMQNKSNDEEMNNKLNICITNLPQTHRENLYDKVFDLFRDCLRLRDVRFKKAVRKDRNDSKPGVIIVTCENMEGKTMIMRAKKTLKNSRKYEKVYIHNEQSVEMQVNNNNMKLLISALGVSGITLRGPRLVTEEGGSHNNIDRTDINKNDCPISVR